MNLIEQTPVLAKPVIDQYRSDKSPLAQAFGRATRTRNIAARIGRDAAADFVSGISTTSPEETEEYRDAVARQNEAQQDLVEFLAEATIERSY